MAGEVVFSRAMPGGITFIWLEREGVVCRIRAGRRPALRQPEGEGKGSGKGLKPDGAIAAAEGGALPVLLLSLIGRFSSRRV